MPDDENKSNTNLEQHQVVEPVSVNSEIQSTSLTESEPVSTTVPEPVIVSSQSVNFTPLAEPTVTVPTPIAPAPAQAQTTAGVFVLQWLTYAFWGWLILALVWLMTIVLANAILDQSVTEMIPYAIAAGVVLLPLAFVTDHFYKKHEPLKKTGGAAVIMVIHTVIFAIFGIIALIVTVFTAINFAISTGTSTSANGQLVSLLVTCFTTLLYAAAFLRTLNPFNSKKPLQIYSFAMLSITILLLIFALVGPLAKGLTTRNDRLIEQNLSTVESSIDNYIEQNEKLPDSLDKVTFSSPEATQLIKDGLVEYKKEASVVKLGSGTLGNITTQHRYQLCVTYTSASSNNGSYNTSYRINGDEYSSYVSTSSHGSGKECYKLQTTTYIYSGTIDNL